MALEKEELHPLAQKDFEKMEKDYWDMVENNVG